MNGAIDAALGSREEHTRMAETFDHEHEIFGPGLSPRAVKRAVLGSLLLLLVPTLLVIALIAWGEVMSYGEHHPPARYDTPR